MTHLDKVKFSVGQKVFLSNNPKPHYVTGLRYHPEFPIPLWKYTITDEFFEIGGENKGTYNVKTVTEMEIFSEKEHYKERRDELKFQEKRIKQEMINCKRNLKSMKEEEEIKEQKNEAERSWLWGIFNS